ncbi:MAG: hypothetical protein WD844_02135 [Thermoleophilaceae bacterium]
MAYGVQSALFQWQDGARRVRDAPEGPRAVDAVVDELRRRLGSTFTLSELTELYAEGVDWAWEVATRRGSGGDASATVNAAFFRYAREATDYAGGRVRPGRSGGPPQG